MNHIFIDTHAHLDGEEFKDDLDLVISRAKQAGIGGIFLPSIDLNSIDGIKKICNEYPDYVFPMIGLHPEEVKADYESVGGLNEDLAVALNDVDYCLKLRRKGLLNVFTPYAELFHYESKSRGTDVTDAADKEHAERYNRECELFKSIWKEELEKGDPYYNVNFTLDRSDYSLRL